MTDRPVRVQLSRKKGWQMPENTVSVARPTKWGNPFRVGDVYPVHEGYADGPLIGQCAIKDARSAKSAFSAWVCDETGFDFVDQVRAELRGKNLACWCPLDQPCHADVLLELANRD